MLSNDWIIALISGGLVASVQLLTAYFWIDRYVEKIQLKAEREKWETSRRELCASLLYFAQSICRPVAHYSVIFDDKLHPRCNLAALFSHIGDKSKDFNALLAIYATAIPPEWYARIVASNFDLQAAAANAKSAAMAWRHFGALLEQAPADASFKKVFDGSEIRAMVEADKYHIPTKTPERHIVFFLFAYYHMMLSIVDAVSRLQAIEETIVADMKLADLDGSEVFLRLTRISQNRSVPFDSSYFRATMLSDLETVRTYTQAARTMGISLEPRPEFD